MVMLIEKMKSKIREIFDDFIDLSYYYEENPEQKIYVSEKINK